MMRIISKALLVTVLTGTLFYGFNAGGAWPQRTDELKPDPEVTWGKLDNGVRYAVRPHNEPPDRVALRLFVHAGSLMEMDDERGLAHFLEHMAFNGTENYPAGKMVEYFQRLGMSYGADTNAHTSYEETVYQLQLPENDMAMLETGMELFRDYADRMLLQKEEIDNERGVILSEMRTRDTIDYRIHKAHMDFLFPGCRVAKRHPIGIKPVIKNAPRERFLNFYHKWYVPGRIAVVAVGDIKTESLEELVQKYFGSMEAAQEPGEFPDLETPSIKGLRTGYHYEEEASKTTIHIETIKPVSETKDTCAKRREEIVRQVANQIISKRLDIMAKDEGSSFNSGDSYAFDWMDYVTWCAVKLTSASDDWKGALQTAEKELRRALKYGFTENELETAKSRMLKRYQRRAESASTRKSGSIADNIVRSIRRKEVFTPPSADLELVKNTLDVLTTDGVLASLRETWEGENRNIFVSGDAKIDSPEQKIKEVYEKSRDQAVEPPDLEETKEFAYKNFGDAGSVDSEEEDDQLGVNLLTLSNNVRVNLKKTDFEANTIHVAVRFGGGKLSLPKNKPGLAVLADRAFVNGGLVKHSKDDIDRLFAGANVGVSFRVADGSFILAGETTPEDLKKQLQVLAAYLIAPGYRMEALRQARKKLRQGYKQLRHTPQGVFQDKVMQFLASGDPRFGFPPEKNVMNLDMEDLQQWLAEPLREAFLSVSIVGDFKKERAIQLTRDTFGALPQRRNEKQAYEEGRAVEFPENADTQRFSYVSEIEKAMSLLFWPGPGMTDISRTRRLQVLTRIMSNKLRKTLREKEAKTYSPGAWANLSDIYKNYGYIVATVTTAPQYTDLLAEEMKKISQELATEGVTKDELVRAKKPMLSQLEETVRNNSYWMHSVLLKCRTQPKRLQWAKTMQQDFRSIKSEDINRLAEKYLAPESVVKVFITPITKQ